MIDAILGSAFLVSTPLLLTAIGGMLNRIGGIVNIGLEAMMLSGAYVALVASSATQSWPLALVAALVTGGLIALLFSLTVTRLGANEIVAGLGFNVAIAGLIGFVLKDYYQSSGTLRLENVVMLPRIDLPGIENIPILGAILSHKDPVTWLAWLSVPLSSFVLARTRAGLRLRAAGEAPAASIALGLRPLLARDISTVVAGAMAGLAGAQLSIGIVGIFNVGISAGRGFIALAAFYFGRNRPGLTALGALLFGFFDAAQINLQGRGVAPELMQMLPYIVVVTVLTAIGLIERRRRLLRGM
ncbi:MAG TPA: ABC transporter permease [Magnetospirillaceae bacterium]|jgi:simple sugar transport system permease protein